MELEGKWPCSRDTAIVSKISQIKPVHIVTPCCFKIRFNIILASKLSFYQVISFHQIFKRRFVCIPAQSGSDE